MRPNVIQIDVSCAAYFALVPKCGESTGDRMLNISMLPKARLENKKKYFFNLRIGCAIKLTGTYFIDECSRTNRTQEEVALEYI